MPDERPDSDSAEGRPSSGTGPRTLGLIGLLIELLLPTALSATLLFVAASYIPFWNLRSAAGLAVFGVLLVAASLFVSFRVDLFTLGRRQRRSKRQFFNRADPWSRLVKLALGGVAVPIAALFAAHRVELPDHRTLMTAVLEARLTAPTPTGAERIGDAVLRSTSPAAKVEGILALQAMDSVEGLDQLFRIVARDPAALLGGAEYRALAKALGAAGAQAEPRLLQLMKSVPASQRKDAASPPGALFGRHFAGSFEGATAEVDARTADPAARADAAARLQAAEDGLKRALDGIESDLGPGGATGLPALVMDALLAMTGQPDSELLAFARDTAADPSWSDSVRGQALMLVAKLGDKDDLGVAYAAMESQSPVIRDCALRAAAELQSRVSAAAKK